MNRSNLPPDEPSLLHILLGRPDENCEVCRAHGLLAHELPEGALGMAILQSGPLEEILRCPCPLCAQRDVDPPEEEPFDDREDPRDN